MIRYALACGSGHEFEAWFGNSADFDRQAEAGLVECPQCGSADVRKQIMAPNVATSRSRERADSEKRSAALAAAAKQAREHIRQNFTNVGPRFPDEARAMHNGDTPSKAIYGQATPDEAKALRDEGVEVSPLPAFLDPDAEKKLN